MRKTPLLYLLLPTMLAAAASLAYYSYSYSEQLAARERQAILQTMQELAKEKLIGIQATIAESDRDVTDIFDLGDLSLIGKRIVDTSHKSATVLGADHKGISGGSFRKSSARDDEAFTNLLIEEVIPDLHLDSIQLNHTTYLHKEYGDKLYLFSCTKVFQQGKVYYLLLEEDIPYLLIEIFPAFFDGSPNLYQVVNQYNHLIYGYAFSGVPADDIVELKFPDVLTGWYLRVAQRDASALASSETRQKTLDLIFISVSLFIIAVGLFVMLLAVQRERKVSRLKSDFISNVSHELKTPLSIISMFGELLVMKRVKSPEQAVEYAEIIRRESMRLSSLIDNVLDFAKIERGTTPYDFAADQDLEQVILRALEIVSPRLEQAKMTVEQHLAEIPRIRLDSNAMVLALVNLLDNAIKYAVAGQKIVVSSQIEDKHIVLSIRDFGPGIERDERHKIFERFYRAKDIRLKPVRGSGIGLSLVKHIVEAHRGRIFVTSEEGCTFKIELPV